MLKKIVCYGLLLLFVACNNETQTAAPPENDVDAARTFIRYALDGKWKDAQRLIVPDSANQEWLAAAERSYSHNDVTEQRGLRESSILIRNTKKINDSTSIVEYTNSFKKKEQVIKAVRRGGQWLIDLKYTFQNTDSTAK